MKAAASLSDVRTCDVLVGVEFGLLAATAEARASVARTSVSRAAWLLTAVEIAGLGGSSLCDAPASLVPSSSAIGNAWAQSAGRQRRYLAQPAPPTEPSEQWEGDYPIDGIHDLPEKVLLEIAADNLPRAEDMCDGTNAADTVEIDFAQDQVEQVIVELVRRGWAYDDPRLDAYRPFARAAAPKKPWEPILPNPGHLAMIARRTYRSTQYVAIGEDWLDGVRPVDLAVAGDARLVLSVDFEDTILLADIESEFHELQQATPGEFHVGYVSTTVTSDPACGIRYASVMMSLEFSGKQLKAVLAFLQRSNIRHWRARIEHRWLFENEHYMDAFVALDWNTHSVKGRELSKMCPSMGFSGVHISAAQKLGYLSQAAQERVSILEPFNLYRNLSA